MEIKNVVAVVLAILFAGMLSSCRNVSKAKPVIEDIYKEYKAASKSDAVKYLKWKNRYEQAERVYNNTIHTPCGTCNGYGVVYLVNEYGQALTDYDGNYQFQLCPNCGGTGEH